VVQFMYNSVILSVAVFQAKRRISLSSGLARTPNCTKTSFSLRPKVQRMLA
jgi:hypothetical protein